MFQFEHGNCDFASFHSAGEQIFPARLALKTSEDAPQVLVIDDEPSVADALRMILEDEGWRVVVAANGREGIEQARRAAFAVTITDLRLPDMNGLDVLEIFRENKAGGAVILITSYSTPEICARARELGAVGIVSKPFLPSEIVRIVNALLKSGEFEN
jgi:DNA-binding response OmpR family regulator